MSCVHAAAAAGVDLVQVRERDLDAGELLILVRSCVERVRGTRTRVIVNDRLDVALAAGAHGVHLPANGLPASRVRAVVPAGFLIGRSIHGTGEAARVTGEGGLDYLIFGTVFTTSSKAGLTPAGVAELAATVRAVTIPVLAIGGVTVERAQEIAGTGAAGAAAIGMFAESCAQGVDSVAAVVAQWTHRWSWASGLP